MKIKKYEWMVVTLIILIGIIPVKAQDPPDSFMYRIDMTNVNIDGNYEDSEYPVVRDISSTGGQKFAELAWGHNDSHIAVYIKILGTGWLGLGMDNSATGSSMDSADILMGYVDGSTVELRDMNAVGTNPPVSDADSYIEPGTYAGVESNGETSMEFIIPMSSSDTAGDDHDWSVGNVYAFFLAYHSSVDALSEYHTAHSPSDLTVEIVDGEFEGLGLEQSFSVTFDDQSNNVTLTTTVFENGTSNPVENLQIRFFRGTHFGMVLINSSTTNAAGQASITFSPNFNGNITFYSIYEGSQAILAHQAAASVDISVETHVGHVEEQEEFGDIRDFFGEEHLMRRFILFGFYLTVFAVSYVYITVIRDVFTLRFKGTKEE